MPGCRFHQLIHAYWYVSVGSQAIIPYGVPHPLSSSSVKSPFDWFMTWSGLDFMTFLSKNKAIFAPVRIESDNTLEN